MIAVATIAGSRAASAQVLYDSGGGLAGLQSGA